MWTRGALEVIGKEYGGGGRLLSPGARPPPSLFLGFFFSPRKPEVLGGRLRLNDGDWRLAVHQRQLMVNRRRLAGDRQQFLSSWCTAEVQAYQNLAILFSFFCRTDSPGIEILRFRVG